MMYCESGDEIPNNIKSCKLKFSSKLNKRAPVFLTDFTNGRMVVGDRSKPKYECFKSDRDINKISYDAERIVLANNGRLDYVGSTASNAAGAPLRYFIGVLSKRTGKMKLYDSILFRMKPVLVRNIQQESLPQQTEKSYWENVNDLTANFGSKGRQRALNSRQKHAVESTLDESLPLDDGTIENLVIQMSVVDNLPGTTTYLPAKNLQASSADEVYNIRDIISEQEDHALDDAAVVLLNSSKDDSRRMTLCKYVGQHLDKGEDNLVKVKYLIYFNYLVSFQHLVYTDIRKKDPAPNIPEPYKQKILETFTVVSKTEGNRFSRSFPQPMKDKLLAYILVLALHIDDFYVDTSLILNNLRKVAVPKFINIAQALGCHISNQKINQQDVKFAILKLPLFVLTPRYAKKSFMGK